MSGTSVGGEGGGSLSNAISGFVGGCIFAFKYWFYLLQFKSL